MKPKKLEIKALKNINTCCKTFGKTGLETTAYLRVLGEAKGLNVDKHRIQVSTEMQKENEVEEGIYNMYSRYCFNNHNVVHEFTLFRNMFRLIYLQKNLFLTKITLCHCPI